MSTVNVSPFRQLNHARYDLSCESSLIYILTTNAISSGFEMLTRWNLHFLKQDLKLAVSVLNYLSCHCFDVGLERWSQRGSGPLRANLTALFLLISSMVT